MGKFCVRENKGSYSFILKAANGETILVSESYTTDKACMNGIESVKKNAAAAVEDQTKEGYTALKHPKYELYLDKAGAYRFRLKAVNGEIVGVGEAYTAKSSCLNGVESVKKNAPEAEIVKD